MSADVTQHVLAAEERRCAAIATEDWHALPEIVADDFLYTHSIGTTEDKESGSRESRRDARPSSTKGARFAASAMSRSSLSGTSVYRYAEPCQGDSPYGAILDVLQVWVRRGLAAIGSVRAMSFVSRLAQADQARTVTSSLQSPPLPE